MTSPEVDVEDLVIAYLTAQDIVPAGQVAARIPEEMTLPFVLVQRIAGGDDWLVDEATIQIDSFNMTQTSASTIAREVNHAMRQLRPKTPVTMPDTSVVIPYGPAVVEMTPVYMPWEIAAGGAVTSRYVARYVVSVRLPNITAF